MQRKQRTSERKGVRGLSHDFSPLEARKGVCTLSHEFWALSKSKNENWTSATLKRKWEIN